MHGLQSCYSIYFHIKTHETRLTSVTSSNIFKVNKGNFSQLLNVSYASYEASWRRPKLFHFEANEANLQPVKNYFNPMLLKEVLTVLPLASYGYLTFNSFSSFSLLVPISLELLSVA